MACWLMKSEPSVYGIADLERDGVTSWEGTRNYQVRNMMRDAMGPGDTAFFYHSSCDEPGVVGTMLISGAAVPDPTQFDSRSPYFDARSRRDNPTWLTVPVSFQRRFAKVIGPDHLRSVPALAGLQTLKRGNRLSVTPISAAEWQAILHLGGR
jgi:predicted RNA-binding protein with PUA-like domain